MVLFSSKALTALSCLGFVAVTVAAASGSSSADTVEGTVDHRQYLSDVDIEATKNAVLVSVYDHSYDKKRGGGGVGTRKLEDTDPPCDISVSFVCVRLVCL